VRLVQQDPRERPELLVQMELQALQATPELLVWQVKLVPPGPPVQRVRMEQQVLQVRLVQQDLREPQALLVQMELLATPELLAPQVQLVPLVL
jgi:hypothetical protein